MKNYPQLVAEAKAGSQNAMTELYAATCQQVYYTIRKLVGNDPDAADLVQETYLRVLTNLDKLAEPAAFGKWCRTIAVNLTRDHLKRSRPVLFGTDEEEQRVLGSVPEESEDCLPAAFAEQKDLRRQVVDMIDSLPESQRTAVYLFYFEERSVAEVAAIMEVSENTIKSRLNYARSKLRELAKKSGVTTAAIPVLTLLLRTDAEATVVPGSINKAVLGIIAELSAATAATAATAAATATTAATAATATTAATTTTAATAATATTAATTTAAAATAVAAGGTALGVKIAAIVVAAGILVGGGFGIGKLVSGREATEKQPAADEADTRDDRPSRPAAAEERAIAAFFSAVEDAGGWESFLGREPDEILEILGTDLLAEESDDLLLYMPDVPVIFYLADGLCWSLSANSRHLPMVDGAYGLDADDLEAWLSGSDHEWYRDTCAPYDENPVTYTDCFASFSVYRDDVRIDIIYWDDVEYSDCMMMHSTAPGSGEPLSNSQLAERLEALGGIEKLLGLTRDEIIGLIGQPQITYTLPFSEYGTDILGYGPGPHLNDVSFNLYFTPEDSESGGVCIRIGGPGYLCDPESVVPVLDGCLGVDAAAVEAVLSERGMIWFPGDYIEGDPLARDYPSDCAASIHYCAYSGSIRCNIVARSRENLHGDENFLTDYIEITWYPEGMDWLDEALAALEAPAYTEDELLAIYDRITGYPGAATGRLMADLTHDGTDEMIVVSRGEENGFERAYCTVYTVADGAPAELWQTSTSTAHFDAFALTLYEEDGADYLMSFQFYLNQGYVSDSYRIWHLDQDGSIHLLREEQVSGPMEETEADSNALAAAIDNMLTSATVLMDGMKYDLFCYTGELATGTTLADGTFLARFHLPLTEDKTGLTAQVTLVDRVTLSDAEMAALTVGGILDLSRFGSDYQSLEITAIDRSDNHTSVSVSNGDTCDFYYSLASGDWQLYWADPNAGDLYAVGGAQLFLPHGGYSVEQSTNMGAETYSDLRDADLSEYSTCEITVENGTVTLVKIFWHP